MTTDTDKYALSSPLTKKFFASSTIPDSQDAINVMDFLTSADSVDRMLVMADLGLPSLSAIVSELEKRFADSEDFPLNHQAKNHNMTNRQNIGRMIKYIMQEFGYLPVAGKLSERARLRDFANSKYFSTSAVYAAKIEKPNYKIKKSIRSADIK